MSSQLVRVIFLLDYTTSLDDRMSQSRDHVWRECVGTIRDTIRQFPGWRADIATIKFAKNVWLFPADPADPSLPVFTDADAYRVHPDPVPEQEPRGYLGTAVSYLATVLDRWEQANTLPQRVLLILISSGLTADYATGLSTLKRVPSARHALRAAFPVGPPEGWPTLQSFAGAQGLFAQPHEISLFADALHSFLLGTLPVAPPPPIIFPPPPAPAQTPADEAAELRRQLFQARLDLEILRKQVAASTLPKPALSPFAEKLASSRAKAKALSASPKPPSSASPKSPSPAPVVPSLHQPDVRAYTVRGLKFEMIHLPPGSFDMGSSSGEQGRIDVEDWETRHRVTLTQGFLIGKHPVTQALWEKIVGTRPSHPDCGIGDDRPVNNVSWRECMSFCDKLTGLGHAEGWLEPQWSFTLPTEAQWEYACRAGTPAATYGPLNEIAWFSWNRKDGCQPVGGKLPNAWGLHDMLGNLLEWCRDARASYPGGSAPVTDPYVEGDAGSSRVYRGGWWGFDASSARAASRYCNDPSSRFLCLGFRLSAVRSQQDGPENKAKKEPSKRSRTKKAAKP